MFRSFFGVIVAGCLCIAPIQQVNAGIIPWTWDAMFGPPGSMQQWAAGYPGGNPYTSNYGGGGGYGYATNYGYASNYGTSTSFYGPSYGSTYSAGYSPYSYGYSTNYGFAGYGDNNCCNPCACSPCGSSGCASGNCANGDCGVNSNYSPQPDTNSTPEPNLAKPNPTTPSDTQTFQKKPITDDFVPRTDTPNNEPEDILPNNNGGFLRPAPMDPAGNGGSGNGGLNPLNNDAEDILPNFNPGGAQPNTTPNPNLNPNLNPDGNAPVFNPRENFDALKPSAEVLPLEIKSTVVGTISPNRQRIVMNTGFRIPSVARVYTQPAPVGLSTDTKIAAK